MDAMAYGFSLARTFDTTRWRTSKFMDARAGELEDATFQYGRLDVTQPTVTTSAVNGAPGSSCRETFVLCTRRWPFLPSKQGAACLHYV
eukprot:2251772-Pleurochrysis_carterae.AAC.3